MANYGSNVVRNTSMDQTQVYKRQEKLFAKGKKNYKRITILAVTYCGLQVIVYSGANALECRKKCMGLSFIASLACNL